MWRVLGLVGEKVPVMGQLSENKRLRALSQALKGGPGPRPTSELSTQLSGLVVPLEREAFLSWELYLFPRAAMTNDHIPAGFQQQAFIPSQFWGPEI